MYTLHPQQYLSGNRSPFNSVSIKVLLFEWSVWSQTYALQVLNIPTAVWEEATSPAISQHVCSSILLHLSPFLSPSVGYILLESHQLIVPLPWLQSSVSASHRTTLSLLGLFVTPAARPYYCVSQSLSQYSVALLTLVAGATQARESLVHESRGAASGQRTRQNRHQVSRDTYTRADSCPANSASVDD